jgi:membrane fusion protein (multidrug efflux system)
MENMYTLNTRMIMKNNYFYVLFLMMILVSFSCGKNKQSGDLDSKKAQLEKLRKEQAEISTKIKKLEEEIALMDSSTASLAKAKLVGVTPVSVQDFSHYIDLQGKIDAEQISYIAPPNGQGGIVTEINIKEGDYVKKGQLVLKLDDKLLRQQIKINETQLVLAKEVLQRTENLWKQNIGSEVQLLQARAQVESLERAIATANEQIRQFTVYAPAEGIADIVNVKVGEFFTGATQFGPQVRIVNNNSLKAVVEIPENYVSRVGNGSPIVVRVPDMEQEFTSIISRTSVVINPNTRTFTAEATIPGGTLRPNSVATIRIKDYSADQAVVIPVNLVQSDQKTKYVFVVENDNKGRKIASKKIVTTGESYNDLIEIKSGLESGMILISEGYQGVYDRQLIRLK